MTRNLEPHSLARERDLLGAALRFIPGAAFGAMIGFWLVVSVNTPVLFFGGIVVAAAVGGLLSLHFGMRFWAAVRHLRWLPF